jgi:hypothetical protein
LKAVYLGLENTYTAMNGTIIYGKIEL